MAYRTTERAPGLALAADPVLRLGFMCGALGPPTQGSAYRGLRRRYRHERRRLVIIVTMVAPAGLEVTALFAVGPVRKCQARKI